MLDSILASVRRPRALLATLTLAALAALAAAPCRAQAPDYSGWQALLDRYLVRVGGKGVPAETRFDYEQLYVDEGIWTRKSSARLESIRAQLLAAEPSRMDARARLAWAINTYNFLVVERATLLLLVPGRQFQRYESVDQMTSPDGMFFAALVADVEGRRYSIGEFERWFVYGDSTPPYEPRRRPGDPRLMFALCRASAGGPALAPRAFRAESLEVQLDAATRSALALPRMSRWDAAARQAFVSTYLYDRRIDFGGTGGELVRFLEKHGPPEVRAGLRREKPAAITRFTPVDPALNQFPRPKPAPPAPAPATKG